MLSLMGPSIDILYFIQQKSSIYSSFNPEFSIFIIYTTVNKGEEWGM
jgi:hypothetical protein